MKGHATDEMVRSGKVKRRDQVHNDMSDIDATKGTEDHGEGVAALAKELAAKHKDYCRFMARIHCVIVAAHKAAAQSRKVHEIAQGKVERKSVLVPKKLSQAQGNMGEYLRVQRIPECFIPPQDRTNVANVTKFLKAYKLQQAPADYPGYSWLELLICFELHGMKIAFAETEEECFVRVGTQAHIAKFRDVVTFIFLHGTTGNQQQLYRAGQPKKLRMKECGIKNAVPCVSFLAEWPDALAEAVQVALLRQAGRFTKVDEEKFFKGQFETEMGPLNLKGVPRWRRKQTQHFNIRDTAGWQGHLDRDTPGRPKDDQVLSDNNMFRKLRCPACGLWTNTAGWQTRRWDCELRSPWRNLKCSHCKRMRNANGWHCTCGVLWFKCAVHNASHLEGAKPKRVGTNEVCGAKCKQVRFDAFAMPVPQLRRLRIRSQPTEVVPLLEPELDEQAAKRFRMRLPPVLQRRFPHLAE